MYEETRLLFQKKCSFKQNDSKSIKQIRATNKKCRTCSPKNCAGHKSCPAYHYKYFDCHKKGQFPGAIVCKCCNKQHSTCCAESESDSIDTSDGKSYSSDDSTDTESTPIQDKNTLIQYWKLSKLVTKIRHVRQKEIRRISKQPGYKVIIAVYENTIPAFADSGADISVRSLTCAKSSSFLLPTQR